MALRFKKALLWVFIVLAGLLAVGALGLLVAAKSSAVRDWVLAKAQTELAASTGAELSIASAQGDLLSGLSLKGVKLANKGRVMVELAELSFNFNPLALLGGRLRIGELNLIEPVVNWPIELASKGGGGSGPPLMVSIGRINLENGQLMPRGQWGSIQSFSAINIEGRMTLDARGVRIFARSLDTDMSLADAPAPYHVHGQCVLSGDTVQATDLEVSQKGNRATINGSLSWARELSLDTKVEGSLGDVKLLPFAWPLPQIPSKPVDFALTVKGPFEDCAIDGWLGLGRERMEIASRLDFEGPAVDLSAQLKNFDPVSWGLETPPLVASGKVKLNYDGKISGAEKASFDLDLTSIAVQGIAQGELKLSGAWEDQALKLTSLAAKGDWGELKGAGVMGPPLDAGAPLSANLEFSGLSCPAGLAGHLPEPLRAAKLSGSLAASGRLGELTLALDLGPSQIMAGVEVASLKAQAGILEDGWRATRLETAAPWGRIAATGQAGPQGAGLDFDLALERMEPVVQALAGFGVAVPELGVRNLSAKGHIKGPWRELEISRLDNLSAQADWGRVSASGGLSPKSADLDFDLAVEQVEPVVKALAGFGVAVAPLGMQNLSAKGHIQGPWRELEISRLDNLSAQADWGELTGSGGLGHKGAALDFKLTVRDWQGLEAELNSQFELELPPMRMKGLSAEGELMGAWSAPDLKVHLEAAQIVLPEGEVGLLDVEANLKNLGLEFTGGVEIEAQDITTGDLAWDEVELSALFKEGKVSLDMNGEGQDLGFSGKVSTAWPWQKDNPVTISGLKATLPNQTVWLQKGPANFTLSEDEIHLDELVMSSGGQRVSLAARTSGAGQISGHFLVRDFLVNPWVDQAGLPEKAVLNARAELAGSLMSPSFTMKGAMTGLKWGRLPEMKMDFSGQYQPGELSVAGDVTAGENTLLQVRASLGADISLRPFVFSQNEKGLTANLKANRLPLALFRPLLAPQVYGLRGWANMELTAKGPLDRPGLEGWVEIPRATFSLESTGQRFSDIEAKLSIKNRRVEVERLSVQSGGEMNLAGFVELPQRGSQGQIELDLKANDFGVSLGSMGSALTNVDLKARGDFGRPVVTGSVVPTKVEIQITGAPPESLSDVVILKPGEKPPPMTHTKEPLIFNPPSGPLHNLTVKVKLDAEKGLTISVDEGWVIMKGAVMLTKKPGGPLIYSDQLNISNGVIIVQGKRFQITGGTIAFAGKDRPDPNFTGEALYQVGQTQIFVTVTGRASDPNVQLSSIPPMNQADILSTIIFGRPARSLNTGESAELSAQAVALLGQRSAQEVQTILGPEFAPDVVTVQDQSGGQGYAVEAGKYLSPELYLRYRKSMGPEGGHNIGLEYQLYHWLSIDSQAGTTRDTGVDLLFNFDFGNP